MCHSPSSRWRSWRLPFEYRVWMLMVSFLPMFFGRAIALALSDPDRPNVVLILSDDQGWGDYGFMGHPHIETPNLDRLAKESLVFTRGYVPTSLCRPSLASLITGLYPHQHGIVGNDPPVPVGLKGKQGTPYTDPAYLEVREQFRAKVDRLNTLPKLLSTQAYQSMQAGKWWEGSYARGGFTHGMTHGDMLRNGRHGDEGLNIGRQGLEAIEQFLKQRESKTPFFLWYAPMMPHTPHNPPARLLDKYKLLNSSLATAKYWAMCEWFDETVGELRTLLDRHDASKNTIIFSICDNGWINDPEASRYAARSKRSPYEGGIRTPIMLHWPGHVTPKMEVEQLASSLDFVPTILDALNLDEKRSLPGISLLDAAAVGERKSVQGEIFEHDVVDMDQPEESLLSRWIVEGQWKLIVPNRKRVPNGDIELYDVLSDPTEMNNLASTEPRIVARLQRLLEVRSEGL